MNLLRELIIILTCFSSSSDMPNSSLYQSDTICANTEQNGILLQLPFRLHTQAQLSSLLFTLA